MTGNPSLTDAAANRLRLHQTVRDIAVLLAAAAVIALLFGGLRLLQANATADWPTAPGVVTASGIETIAIPGRAIRYEPAVHIAYDYEVAGQRYAGTAVSPDRTPVLAGLPEAERLLATYPVGSAVSVLTNPANPAESYLETAAPEGLFTPGLLLLAGAAAVGLVAWLLRP